MKQDRLRTRKEMADKESYLYSADKDPRVLARFLVGAVQGLRVMSKVSPDRERLRDITDIILASLD